MMATRVEDDASNPFFVYHYGLWCIPLYSYKRKRSDFIITKLRFSVQAFFETKNNFTWEECREEWSDHFR